MASCVVGGINLSVMSSVTSALLAQDPTQALLVSVVWYSRITDGHPRTFRYCLSSDKETNAMATYLAARGLKKVAFLYVNDEFGLDAHECFKTHAAQKGLTLAFRESFDKTGADIDGVVTKALTINPEAVYFVGYANSLAIIAKRLNELSYRGVRCSFSSFLVPQVLQQAGTSSEGVLFTSAGYDPMAPVDDVQRRFIDAYQASFSKKPDYYAAFCYDIMNIFLDNWERSGKD